MGILTDVRSISRVKDAQLSGAGHGLAQRSSSSLIEARVLWM
jgi:hypothetical protein